MTVCLVTGGAGFIGSHLVDALLERGCAVRVLDNFSTGNVANLAQALGRIDLVLGDLVDLSVVRRAVAGVELVFHHAVTVAAAYTTLELAAVHNTNTAATRNVLVAAREAGARRVVYASSAAVYGRASFRPRGEGSPTQPLSP